MRTILVLLILAAIAFGLGWLHFRDTGGTFEMIIDKEKVLEDKKEAIEKGREWIDQADQPQTPDGAERSEPAGGS